MKRPNIYQYIITQFQLLKRASQMLFRAAPTWTTGALNLLILQGFLPAITVTLLKYFVDSLVQNIGQEIIFRHIKMTLLWGILTAGSLLLSEILQNILSWMRIRQSEMIQDYISDLIHEKSTKIDYGFFESPGYHDLLERAANDARENSLTLLENGGNLLQNMITLLAMVGLLFTYNIWLPFLLVASALPALLVVVRYNWRYHKWWEETTPDRRWANYFNYVLTSIVFAAELRSFELGDYFRKAYQAVRKRLRQERFSIADRETYARIAAGAGALLTSAVVMIWMVLKAIEGLISLGDLTLIYQAFSRGQNLLRTLLGNLGRIYSNSLFLGNFFEFLDTPHRKDLDVKSLPSSYEIKKGITLKNVFFQYPGNNQFTLQNLNLEIKTGQMAAIVGTNGAGKSTLVKLFCRLYDVTDGHIKLDNINLSDILLKDLRELITVLYQFPVPFYLTAGESIRLGDLNINSDSDNIKKAAQAADAHSFINELHRGYNTQLGKWFSEGVELSGGQWQRIALGRTFLRNARIIILDEPTSFMDSWTEIEWMDKFRQLAAGRIAILITHRFTTAMRADIIHVMDRGSIVESGTHQQLLEKNGLYARSWQAQMNTQ